MSIFILQIYLKKIIWLPYYMVPCGNCCFDGREVNMSNQFVQHQFLHKKV